jgi:hypothetical protein
VPFTSTLRDREAAEAGEAPALKQASAQTDTTARAAVAAVSFLPAGVRALFMGWKSVRDIAVFPFW